MTTPEADPRPDRRALFLVMCVECGKGVEAPLPMDHNTLALFLARHGWFVSVLTPPGQDPEVPILFGALCETCAPTVFPPEVLKVFEERRQKMLEVAPR